MKKRAQIAWLLALVLAVCSGCSTRPDSAPLLPYYHGSKEFVWVASFSEFGNPQSDTAEIIAKILTREGTKGGMESLSASCDLYVSVKDRLKAIKLLESSPELKGHRLRILTDAEIKRMNEPKVAIFSLNFRSPAQDHVSVRKVTNVLADAGIRWQTRKEDGRLAFSVATSQKRSALKLLKNNAALQGIDIQLVKQEDVK